jgi:eukaryotic-like serine/threonine-protein kinase
MTDEPKDNKKLRGKVTQPSAQNEAKTVFMPQETTKNIAKPATIAAKKSIKKLPSISGQKTEEKTQFRPSSDRSRSSNQNNLISTPKLAAKNPVRKVKAPAIEKTVFVKPLRTAHQIQVGDVLNHIFEVTRFIARGGMGEVFEGININSEESVAIKVMLPELAADPKVIGMFRKEAQALTKLQHEALVQYRILAQEPKLGVLYIVTDYINGDNLSDVLGRITPSLQDQINLLRRMAAGLRSAHALGAIHRDVSPDNILLPCGHLDRAKLIDFGISKDMQAGSATIVGDGFAGKLSYVAPEQLGDHGGKIGSWTDIYSLGLVMLAVAKRENVPMGGALVDAVDKRRVVPDVSDAPEPLRPLLTKMLQPDPADRYQTMGEVLIALDDISSSAPRRIRKKSDDNFSDKNNKSQTKKIIVTAVSILFLLGAAGAGIWNWKLTNLVTINKKQVAQRNGNPAITLPQDPGLAARQVIDSALPSIGCTWLSILDVTAEESGAKIRMAGVAGNPSVAQNDLARSFAASGVDRADIDFDNVAPITQAGCAALDTYRQVRDPQGQKLSIPQRKFEMTLQEDGKPYAGKIAANAVIEINVGAGKSDMALIGLEPSGLFTVIARSRVQFEELQKNAPQAFTNLGEGRYRMLIDLDHAGWSGILLVSGNGPMPENLIAPGIGARGSDWQSKFISQAATSGWQTEMIWFRSVDEQPN